MEASCRNALDLEAVAGKIEMYLNQRREFNILEEITKTILFRNVFPGAA